MTDGLKTMIFPVTDVSKAKAIYGTLLGIEPSVDSPYYVGFDVAGQHIGLVPNGHAQGITGAVAYWHVADIQKHLDALLAAGAQVQQAIKDVGNGRLVASVTDADGNAFGLVQG